GERIFQDFPLAAGANALSFRTPADAVLGPTFLRFRFSTFTGLAPTGIAPDGEVEDYRVNIDAAPAQASTEDSYQNSLVIMRVRNALGDVATIPASGSSSITTFYAGPNVGTAGDVDNDGL